MPLTSVIGTRLLFAALLLFGSDILLWTNPPAYSPLEWLLRIIGHVALGAALLDVALRFRVRHLFGLLALAGMYGLCASLLLHPAQALADLPASLFARVLGAQTFAALLVLLLFLRLTNRGGRLTLVIGAALAGVGWGVWARWSPSVILGGQVGETPLIALLVAAVSSAVIIAALLLLVRAGVTVRRLARLETGLVAAVVVGLLGLRLVQGLLDGLALTVGLVLLVYCGFILGYLRSKRAVPLFVLEGNRPDVRLFLLLALVFAAAGIGGYHLPRGEAESDPVALIGLLFTTFGLVWLPTVSLVLGGRALLRQVGAEKL